MKLKLFLLLLVAFLPIAPNLHAQTTTVENITVTNAPTPIVITHSAFSVLIQENSSTPTAVWSVETSASGPWVNLAAGQSFVISSGAPPMQPGQTIGYIQATTSGPFTFSLIENPSQQSGAGAVQNVTAASPLQSTGGNTPQISCPSCAATGALPQSITNAVHKWLNSYDKTTGLFTQTQPACGDLSNAAASCSTDATDATNIGSGTLGAARLPNPTASTLGGIESYVAVTHQWLRSISTSGVPAGSQPACADLSDAAASCSAVPTVYYQTAQQTGVAVTQRSIINFLSPLSISDNSSNSSSDVTCTNCLNQANNAQNANQIISGGMVEWTGNYNFTIGAAIYTISGVNYSSPSTNITLSAADPTLDRIDVFAVDNTGTVVVLIGTPAATPLQPTIDPTTQLQLSFAYVSANTTAPTQITRNDIYHENTDWATSRSGTVFNLASTNNPYDGTKDIEATAATLNSWVQFLVPASGTVDVGTVNALVFYVRSKATWNVARSLSIQWQSTGTVKGQIVVLRDGTFGFSSAITASYQQISIPTSLFGISGVPVNQLRITVSGTGASTIGFYLDDITLQGGAAQVTLPSGLMVYRGAWSTTTAFNVNDVVTSGEGLYLAIQAGTNHTPASSTTFWIQLAFSASYADAEVPSGTINSSNATFTLAHTVSPAGSLQLFKNGLLQKAGGTDYTLSGLTITYAIAPATGDSLIASYRY